MHMRSYSKLAAILVVMAGAGTAHAMLNMIDDPGFESGGGAGAAWINVSRYYSTLRFVHSGSWSCQHINGEAPVYQPLNYFFQPDMFYEMSFWVRYNSQANPPPVAGEESILELGYDLEGSFTPVYQLPHTAHNSWTQAYGSYTTALVGGELGEQMIVRFYHTDADWHPRWYDDFFLSPKIPGDANRDGWVDTQDFSILKGHFGEGSADWADGDFNADTIVDTQDFSILKANFGRHAPEPATLALLGAGGLAVLIRRRR